jgi:hypothetical protein
MMDRRTFIWGAGLVALTPAIAALLPISAKAQQPDPVFNAPVPPTSGAITDPKSVVFKIDGWDSFESTGSSKNEVLFRITQSWRTAWR